MILFSAVQNSSIGNLVTQSVSHISISTASKHCNTVVDTCDLSDNWSKVDMNFTEILLDPAKSLHTWKWTFCAAFSVLQNWSYFDLFLNLKNWYASWTSLSSSFTWKKSWLQCTTSGLFRLIFLTLVVFHVASSFSLSIASVVRKVLKTQK